MAHEPDSWNNRSPGNLDLELGRIDRTPVEPAVRAAQAAFRDWARRPLTERVELLRQVHAALASDQEELARGISLETGKPLREARGEVTAVLAKFELSFADAALHLSDHSVQDGPHPAWVRRRARGPAAVVGPFNFPLHLGHGASLPHLLAGNPVLFKPSPLAGAVAGRYGRAMEAGLPPGVFQTVQGGAATSGELCLHRGVRSVCFTGSAAVGRQLAAALATDLGKDLALELGGKNAVIVCEDAQLVSAAQAVAEGMCLTAGQRCNATSRILVARTRAAAFLDSLADALRAFVPDNPLLETTRLGALIGAPAVERYQRLQNSFAGDWLIRGQIRSEVNGQRGYYVTPSVVKLSEHGSDSSPHPFLTEEAFCPIASFEEFEDLDDALRIHNLAPFGLTCSVFTAREFTFWRLADELAVGNVYANLPTTFSPSTLPFGGWGDSGNRRPGGRGFIRFVTDEQAVQVAKGSW
jgi:succinylglutamic semialdehyde dehydrogenase